MLHLLKFNFDNVIQLFIMFCLHLIGPIFNVFGNPLGSHWTTLSFHLTCSVFKMFEMNIIHYKKSWSFQFDKLVKKVKICTFSNLTNQLFWTSWFPHVKLDHVVFLYQHGSWPIDWPICAIVNLGENKLWWPFSCNQIILFSWVVPF
jgi:hypothetical protein